MIKRAKQINFTLLISFLFASLYFAIFSSAAFIYIPVILILSALLKFHNLNPKTYREINKFINKKNILFTTDNDSTISFDNINETTKKQHRYTNTEEKIMRRTNYENIVNNKHTKNEKTTPSFLVQIIKFDVIKIKNKYLSSVLFSQIM